MLQGNLTAELRVLRKIEFSHATGPQTRSDQVASDLFAGQIRLAGFVFHCGLRSGHFQFSLMLSHAFRALTNPAPVARSLPANALWCVAVLPAVTSLAVLHKIVLICFGERVGFFCRSSAMTPAI